MSEHEPRLIQSRELLKQARTNKKLSARHLSLAAGLSPSYVSKVEAGEIEPSLKAFNSIASVLKLTDVEILFIVRNYR